MITVTIKISYICKCINFAAKIVQGERRTKQTCLFFQPSRSLSYQKIVQGSHYKQTCLFFQPSRSLSYVQAVSKDCLDDENITFRK